VRRAFSTPVRARAVVVTPLRLVQGGQAAPESPDLRARLGGCFDAGAARPQRDDGAVGDSRSCFPTEVGEASKMPTTTSGLRTARRASALMAKLFASVQCELGRSSFRCARNTSLARPATDWASCGVASGLGLISFVYSHGPGYQVSGARELELCPPTVVRKGDEPIATQRAGMCLGCAGAAGR